MPTAEQSVAAVRIAAPWWGLDAANVEVVSESENVVCSLTEPSGRRVIVRLHRPGYNSVDELTSEVAWVDSLRRAGLPVPTPVPTLTGDYYRAVPVGDEQRQAGVVAWVNGAPLGSPVSATAESVADHYARIGEIAAAIRAHDAAWSAPPAFVRRRWDAEGLLGSRPLWGRFWEVGALSSEHRQLFTRAREELLALLESLPQTGDRFGLIHADLHLGNIMADGAHVTAIDFDDAGYGWFVYELAVALHPVLDDPAYADARQRLLEGYRRVHPFDEHEEALIDAFLVIRCLIIVGWLDARPELPVHSLFHELVEQAADVAGRYLADGRL
ncbi:MAG: phosphotransferase [Actinomycetota bacterium]